ncbi:DNA repair protein endonuclease SAE2/CtIP C-terminus-domain-containing protein [Usnea florida]
MDSSGEPESEIQHTVKKYVDGLEYGLTRELTKKLTERDRIFSVERSGYLQEINALRMTSAKSEKLEAENTILKAQLEECRRQHQESLRIDGWAGTSKAETKAGNPTVSIGEYNRVKEDFVTLERDYGRLVFARDHLETKVREQKHSIKQWKDYCKNWILKYPNKRLSHLKPSSTRASPVMSEETCRSSSAPAPPAPPESLTSSLNGVSRSPTPHQNALAEKKDVEDSHDQAFKHHSKDGDSLSKETSIPNPIYSSANASDSGDITEATAESEGQVEPMKIEPATGGSSPVIVFERSLKRRHSARGSARNIHVHDDLDRTHSEAAPVTLATKNENISSPIPFPPLLRSDGPQDSLDLDDVGGPLDTPRKRQRMEQDLLESSMMVPRLPVQDGEDMLDDMTTAENARHFDDDDSEITFERDGQASSITVNSRPSPNKTLEEEKKARKDERTARQHAHNDRVHQRLEAANWGDPSSDIHRYSSPTTGQPAQRPLTPKHPRESYQRKPPLASPVILQPRDVNGTVLPRTSDPLSNRKRPFPPSRRDHGAAHVPAVAEDGEGSSSNRDALKAWKKSKADQNDSHGLADKELKPPPTHHRLGALLTKPSPEKSALISEDSVADVVPDQTRSRTSIPRSVDRNKSKGPTTPRSLPARRSELPRGPGDKSGLGEFEPVEATMDRYSKSAQADSKRTRNVPAFRKPPVADYTTTGPDDEPLRARPVHRLGLQDFRINPAHNEYAYHETVRKYDEKKCLTGCTDRHCVRCKGLREFVINSGYKTAQKPGETEKDADWRLMQDFLGDNRRKLRSMSAKEKSDLLTEAKVQEFANRFGSHRQSFSRAREAPGFWDVDFPTTQDDVRDRAAADVIEREKVQERYWEAMRPKGKWIFADE